MKDCKDNDGCGSDKGVDRNYDNVEDEETIDDFVG